MNTVSHALLPVIAAGVFERSYLVPEDRRGLFSPKMLMLIGVFGAAADLLNPHISLDDRYSSWSHGIPFWLMLTVGILLVRMVRRRLFPFYIIACLSGAYAFHLYCDAISGGIAWWYPFRDDVIGGFYVEPIWWVPLDVVCCLFSYALFRVIPRFKSIQPKQQT